MSLTSPSGSGAYDPLSSAALAAAAARLGDQSQIDFDVEFFERILEREPNFVDVLRCQGELLARRGQRLEGLVLDRRLRDLVPTDGVVRYNLACSLAVLGQVEEALAELRQALELGYREAELIAIDADLESLRELPQFRGLCAEFGLE